MIELGEVPIEQLRELLDAAVNAGDAALVAVYAEALEAAATLWTPLEHQVIPDGPWAIWVLLGGRGTGKSDAGAHAMNTHALGPPCDTRLPGGHRMRIIGPTFTDTVASCVNGPSGLKAHNPGVTLLGTKEGTIVRWPSGAYARVFGAYSPEDPERLRAGGNSCFDWCEELAAWRQLDAMADQAAFGLRLGDSPRTIITTTPKNRARIHRLDAAGARFAASSTPEELPRAERVHLTRASTAANPYLAADVRDALYAEYGNRRLGAQELEAQLLDDLGTMFSRAWFAFTDAPKPWPRRVRSWDLAATPPGPVNEDPDWTVGALVSYQPSSSYTLPDGSTVTAGSFCVEDVIRLRETPASVEQAVLDAARRDGPAVKHVFEREPGQSGKSQIAHLKQLLAGVCLVDEFSPSGPKVVRAQLVSGAAEQGRVELVRAPWNLVLLDELEEFTGTDADRHDDQVDALSQAFAVLEGRGGAGRVATSTTASMPTRDAIIASVRLAGRGRPSAG